VIALAAVSDFVTFVLTSLQIAERNEKVLSHAPNF